MSANILNVKKIEISPEKIYCVIFDMDGVVTKTADVHSLAWKKIFDEFLKKNADKNNIPFVSFDKDKDYAKYVDGKPRLEGIQSFLKSRGIELSVGNDSDTVDSQTVIGLGKKKNKYFTDLIKENGVEPFESTINLIQKLKKNGIKIAIVSSSKNCKNILEAAGVLDLFEARIDGVYSEKHGIKGKPEPDIFLEAAKQLCVDPKHCIGVEDAVSGVQACSRAGFAQVIGVDRINQEKALYENGADVVVKDLIEVSVVPLNIKKDALNAINEIKELTENKQIVIFLDYDGTLSPIAETPELAFLPNETKETLEALSKKYIVAIISGRDKGDVKKSINLENLYYAGSHGYEITGPNNVHFEIPETENFIHFINEVNSELRERLESINGVIIERKKFGIAVHYRLVSEQNIKLVKEIVEEIHNKHLELRITSGKKVLEFQPKIDWNKGKALLWLLKCLNINQEKAMCFYIGDDFTDEDAFKAIKDTGIGISVQDNYKPTHAKYTLKDPKNVQIFLEKLLV